ncbi:MAG TPA: GYD domain-containing protein [Longimicrobiales bacterium]|nr:GYD domain-containing protein [Longimicrobiales bacterium]
MPQYMTQFAYTPEAWAALVANPVDRSEPLRALVEKLGGRLISFHYTMGKWDGVLVTEAPDEATATAAILAAISAGHLKATRMTRLIPVSEAMEAMRKAQGVTYKAPSR